jgi:hypothetical protein
MGCAHRNLAVSSDSIITPLNTVALVSLRRFPTADRLGVNERQED